jgi:septal ring factor EnvC (AmiA/AmiB activator)
MSFTILGNATHQTARRTESATTVGVSGAGLADIEAIVATVIEAPATQVLRSEFDNVLSEFRKWLSVIESNLDATDDRHAKLTTYINDLAAEIDAARNAARQIAVAAKT